MDVVVESALPVVELPKMELDSGVPAFELFRRAGLAASNGEARRLVKGGGAKLNNAPISEETRVITAADLDAGGILKLSAGKKRHALVRAV
jgi:tyrosyl-tRNA synthetase